MVNEFSYLDNETVVIAANAAETDTILLSRYGIVRLTIPSTWTAASLSFQVADDGVNFADLYDSTGSEVVVTATAGKAISVDPTIFGLGFTKIRLRSGTSAAPVNQTQAASIVMAVRPL